MLHSRRRTLLTQKMLGPSDGAREHVFSSEGRAPCVLGLHGFTGTASELRPLVDTIARHGYAVDVPLLAGHGESADALQALHFDDWVDSARTRFDALATRYGAVVLCGFSLGSLIAMHLAAERPRALAGLIVLGNALELHRYASVPFGVARRLGVRVPDWYLVKFRAADMKDRAAAAKIATYDRHPLRAAFEVYLAGERVRREVSRIACPTLVLHGKNDRVCPPSNARWLASHVGAKDVTVRVYAESGHVIAADVDKDRVADDVLRFLARVRV
jgi:carboxylesterase